MGTTITKTAQIARPGAEVMAVLRDITLLPHLSGLTTGVEGDPGRPLQVGDTFTQDLRIVGLPLHTTWTVAEQTPTRLVCRGESTGGGQATLTESLLEAGPVTTVSLEVDYDLPGGFLGEAVDKLFVERRNEREAEHILANLKDLVESRPAAG